jgi:hypothetical protein
MYANSNDAAATRELNDAELEAVSGRGSLLSAGTAGATAGATGGVSDAYNFFLEAAKKMGDIYPTKP